METLTPSFRGKVKQKGGRGTLAGVAGTLGIAALFCVATAGLGGMMIFLEEAANLNAFGPVLFCVPFGGLLLLIFGAMIGVPIVRRQLQRQKIADATVQTRLPVKAGQRLNVDYRQEINGDVEIQGVTVRLLLREWVRYRSGTDTVTATHDHIVEERQFPGGSYGTGEIISHSLDFRLPETAIHTWDNRPWLQGEEALDKIHTRVKEMPAWARELAVEGLQRGTTTALRNNRLTWHIHIVVEMARWPDYSQAFELPVMPAIAEEEEGFGGIW